MLFPGVVAAALFATLCPNMGQSEGPSAISGDIARVPITRPRHAVFRGPFPRRIIDLSSPSLMCSYLHSSHESQSPSGNDPIPLSIGAFGTNVRYHHLHNVSLNVY